MSYRFGGRRSTGCDKCRSAKLKCDEKRPSCTRCSRMGKTCRYRDALDLAFHDQTEYASQRAEALWQKRSSKVDKDTGKTASSPQITPIVQAVIPQPLYEVALQRLFFDYVFPYNPTKGRTGHLEHLPTMYEALQSNLCFASALKVTALANLARRCGSTYALEGAYAEYNIAVSAANSALRHPATAAQDSVLLACYLLAICELNMSESTAYAGWQRHTQGALALLEYRGSSILEKPLGATLFKIVYAQELFKCLRLCQRPTYVPDFIQQAFDPLSARVQLLVAEISALCADFLDTRIGSTELQGLGGDTILLSRARSLVIKLQRVVQSIPPRYRFEEIPAHQYRHLPFWIEHLITDPRAPTTVQIYSAFGLCFFWNTIRFAEVRLHQLLILLSERLTTSGIVISSSVEALKQLGNSLCSTVCAMLLVTEERDVRRQTRGQDIPSFRSFLLLRVLCAARMAYAFLAERDIPVHQKLCWLEEVFECMRDNLVIIPPPDFDALGSNTSKMDFID